MFYDLVMFFWGVYIYIDIIRIIHPPGCYPIPGSHSSSAHSRLHVGCSCTDVTSSTEHDAEEYGEIKTTINVPCSVSHRCVNGTAVNISCEFDHIDRYSTFQAAYYHCRYTGGACCTLASCGTRAGELGGKGGWAVVLSARRTPCVHRKTRN